MTPRDTYPFGFLEEGLVCPLMIFFYSKGKSEAKIVEGDERRRQVWERQKPAHV